MCTRVEAESATKLLTDSLFDVAKNCFKLAKRGKRRHGHKPKKNPWYTNECEELKKRLRNIANLLTKAPKDPHIRGKYFVIKKQYRKSLKYNKKRFELTNLQTLQNLKHSPK